MGALLPIKQAIVPDNHPIRSHTPMAPKWITIHETANTSPGANAEMHARYMLSQEAISRDVLWHASVDSAQIIQHLPWNEVGWHAGDGLHGPGNTQSIGIELCVNSDGDFAATQRNAAQLVAYLVQNVPSLLPFPDCIVQHNRWSGKDCPHQLRATPGAWDAFVGFCKAEIDQAKAPTPPAVRVIVNGQEIDCKGRIEDGHTLAYLRPVAVALGASYVSYDEATRTVAVTKGVS